jgi:uncharacterized protein DUF1707
MCWQGHDRFRWSEHAARGDRSPRYERHAAAESHADLRISDADRHAVIDELRRHTGDGRLTLDEFEERVDEVLRARRQSELDTATRELPSLAPTTSPRRVGFRLPVRPGLIAACLVVLLLMAGHWWVLIPLGFFVMSRHSHRAPGARFEGRNDPVTHV